ncbi:hypothetical protein [Streptomyces sp. SID1121]|uniref:hypothetical protein n=1 Tax=Streptomyces sp. SID1121 TaxID=3425888 RepID=UPI0040576335
MSLMASEFFTELCLPFSDYSVVADTYFAVPVPGAPLRLRIDFAQTLIADTYGGLRVAAVHPDRGVIDAVALSFLDHGTFHRRDEAHNYPPGYSRTGTFDTYRKGGRSAPWEGAVLNSLRDAIEQYTSVWFPGAWATSTPSHAARETPAPMVSPSNGRRR